EHIVLPHTESRMVPSKLLALGLLAVNGQWDARLESTFNAVLFAGMAVLIALALVRVFGAEFRIPIFVTAGAYGALPYAWENTIWGFQLSFYCLIFFSLLTIWGLGLNRAFSAGWFVGAIAAIIAPVSMAAGFVAIVAVLGVETLRLLTKRRTLRASAPTLLACAATLALALYFRVYIPEHEPYRAPSLAVWAQVATKFLGWPFEVSSGFLLAYLPLAFLLLRYVRRARASEEANFAQQAETLFLLGALSVLLAAGIAYARAMLSPGATASRYMDALAPGFLANVLAVFVFLRQANPRKLLASAWLGCAVFALVLLVHKELGRLKAKAEKFASAEQAVRAYIASGDISVLPDTPPNGIPYPDRGMLASFVDDPVLRQILPASLRPPLELVAEEGMDVFARQGVGEHAWTSDPAVVGDARGTMTTQLLEPTLPYLQVELFGRPGPGMQLMLKDENSEDSVTFRTFKRDDGWRVGLMRVPGRKVRLVARDDNAAEAFAFREPREIGRWSVYAERLLLRAPRVLALGLALAVSLLALASVRGRSAAGDTA
ncbi:MAG TPA: hypothetical protein VG095_06865, partial [Chthoniobacterales bacterium]|nr:hypothetical protein [Chthoniobacterales bacterium]